MIKKYVVIALISFLSTVAAKLVRTLGIEMPISILSWYPSFAYALGISCIWMAAATKFQFPHYLAVPVILGSVSYELSQIFDHQQVFSVADIFASLCGFWMFLIFYYFLNKEIH